MVGLSGTAKTSTALMYFAALGDDKVSELLPDILAGCADDASAAAREGFSMLWTHLPEVLGKRFEPYLKEVLPVVLEGLADDVGAVRETWCGAASAPGDGAGPRQARAT